VVWGAAGSKATRSAPSRGGLSASERAKDGGWRFKAEPVVIQSTRIVALIGDQLTLSPSQLVDTHSATMPQSHDGVLEEQEHASATNQRSYVASSSELRSKDRIDA
jgi:hypothetical protein